ncbi:AAHS family benzoate transporter-like MFS transporter [Acinetobacter calcoaceticus]|uniref:AAHS family benzoate transporter-like MFS transporter n=1 Tax=Acinetobacter calcoaceticus TaxID=471 RepID=A0A4R1XUI7_ACICA|nr:AAHS family benzoate transporter-like MFS transporter [Acinetobacter calcoaceticus]
MTAQTMNVNAVIDNAKFKPFHALIVIWCLIIVVFDGYDLAINGVTLPLLMKEWGLTAVQAGMLASTALCGMMFGAMLFGMLADKIGRKNVIIICVTLFSGFTFWGGFASNPYEFGALRFIAGLGIGGVLPNLVALTYEYSPKRLRGTLVTLMFSGYAMGGIVSALVGKWLIAEHGWQIMFYLAGLALFLVPFIWKFLPESITFLVKKQRIEQAQLLLKRVAPEQQILKETRLELDEVEVSEASVKELFKQGRGVGTILFWCSFFMGLLMLYALGSWLPKLMIAAGYSMGTSLTFLLSMNIGAVIGVIGGGMLSDKLGLKPVIITMLLMGALALFGLGFKSPQYILYFLVAVTGASATGASILLYSYVAEYYPLSVRSTGIGTASGIGRIGAIVGPIVIGALLGMELPHQWNFIAIAIPAMICVISVALIKAPKTQKSSDAVNDYREKPSLSS